MQRVGVRDLRLNASKVLAQVQAGESVEVTSRGRPVARIVPMGHRAGLAQLIAEGLASAPEEAGDLLDIPPAEPVAGAPLPSEVLAAMRTDER